MRGGRTLFTEIATLDSILDGHREALGADVDPYRHHTYRVANLCLAQIRDAEAAMDKVAIAVAFHDLGIWTDHTFDYLAPSVRLATAYLADTGRASWTPEISAMIREHHKITPYRDAALPLVEPFRRADWIDVTRGVLPYGTPRPFIRELYKAWPDLGFHKRLVQLELGHLRKHPLNPLPVLRW